MRLPVLVVADPDLPDPVAALPEGARFLESVGAPPIELCPVGRVALPQARIRFGSVGGMGAPPWNSQALVRAALAALPEPAQRQLEPKVAVVVPPGFHPHAWHLREGGYRLASGLWVRQYALLPDAAPRGPVAHELGHLLFGWPDLASVWGLGAGCLMARGAARGDGHQPAPPCAALRLRERWAQALPLREETPGEALPEGEIWQWRCGDMDLLLERQAQTLQLLRLGRQGWPSAALCLPAGPAPVASALGSALARWVGPASS